MPKIPIIQAEMRLPVGNVVQPLGLQQQAQLGQSVQGLMNTIAEEEAKVREQQRKIQLQKDYDLAEMDVELEAKNLETRLRSDPKILENPASYFDEYQKGFDEIVKQRIDQIKILSFRDKNTKQIIDSELRKKIGLRELIQQKDYGRKLWVNDQKATDKILFDFNSRNGEINKIIDSIERQRKNGIYTGPEAEGLKIYYRDKIQTDEISLKMNSQNVEMIQSLVDDLSKGKYKISDVERNSYRSQAEKKIETIKKTAKTDDDEKNITNAIREAKNQFPDSPDLQNMVLTNIEWQKSHGLDSNTAHAAQERLKAEQVLMHDIDERKIGDLFIKKDYVGALKLIESSGYIKGDEKKAWSKAIETEKDRPEKIDPNVEAAEIVKINDLISKDVNPNVIKNSIIISSRLSASNKEQYLLKLETKLGREIKDGRNLGYKDIQDIIIPKRGMLTDLLETPSETMAVKKAQMALDDWIDNQTKTGKAPSMMDVRKKAQDLANQYQVGIAEKITEMEKAAKKTAEEIKKAKEKK